MGKTRDSVASFESAKELRSKVAVSMARLSSQTE